MIIIPLKSCPAKDFELKIELDAPTSLQQNAMRVSNNNLAPEQHRFFQFLIITSPHSAVRWTATAVNHNFNHWAKITTCTFNFLWLCDNLWNVLYFQARVAGSQVNLETRWQVCIWPKWNSGDWFGQWQETVSTNIWQLETLEWKTKLSLGCAVKRKLDSPILNLLSLSSFGWHWV